MGTVEAMTRQCNRSACSDTSAATLGYDYGTRTAWIVDVVDVAHPATYDLCNRHADGLTIPMGWELHDQRRIATPLFDQRAQAS